MQILVTGAAGMLGSDVCRAAAEGGLEVTGYDHEQLDVTDARAVEVAVRELRPGVVVNCAGWTDVDRAEAEAQQAHAVNGTGAWNLACAAARYGAWTVQISTDYVFDGSKPTPYVESDPVGPLSEYGRSKLAGEQAVARAAPERHTIVRCSWLFGLRGRCFPKTILRLGAERDELTVVDDQRGCPTFTAHLAPALVELISSGSGPPAGVLHLACSDSCTWFELASEIVRAAGLSCVVHPGATEELSRPAPRPANSVLASERPEAPILPDWRQGLAEYLSSQVPVR